MQLTNKTALDSIKAQVYEDFRITIDSSDARKIRDAHRRGAVAWTPNRLSVTLSSFDLTITPHHVRFNGTGYSSSEWHA